MAEPLTSSDIWRTQRGWGVSPLASEEERKRFAAAGESPLTTQARERFETGRGISPMASQSEREAWKVAEIQAGTRSPMELPESYGGMGDRPKATTRRGFRMQQEWDKQYEMMRKQEEEAREENRFLMSYELQRQQEERMKGAQDLQIQAGLAKQSRQQDVERQAQDIMNNIVGFTRPDGSKQSPINVNDEDAPERLQMLIANNRRGMESQDVKEVVTMMLNDALDIRAKRDEEIMSDIKAKAGLAKDLSTNGLSIGEFTKDGKIDYVAASDALGKAIAKGRVEEEERKSSTAIVNDLQKDVIKIRGEVARYQKLLEASPSNREVSKQLQGALADQGVLEDEINRLSRPREGGATESEGPTTTESPAKELSQQDKTALNWANANPDDPRAKRIKDKLGVQ